MVLLTDMFGGTPSNLAISVLDRANVEVIAGINLPMLIKLAGCAKATRLQAAVTAAQEAGRKYINVASQLLAASGAGMPPMSAGGAIVRIARIRNQRGLHARAAAKFVKLAGAFDAQIRVIKGDMDVSGRSIMGLMMLAAGIGTRDRAARQRAAGAGGACRRWSS